MCLEYAQLHNAQRTFHRCVFSSGNRMGFECRKIRMVRVKLVPFLSVPLRCSITVQELSAKVSTLAHLCSEQLSQQPHYDFGMRAVKSILVFAGQAKRQQKRGAVESEEDVLIQARVYEYGIRWHAHR